MGIFSSNIHTKPLNIKQKRRLRGIRRIREGGEGKKGEREGRKVKRRVGKY